MYLRVKEYVLYFGAFLFYQNNSSEFQNMQFLFQNMQKMNTFNIKMCLI